MLYKVDNSVDMCDHSNGSCTEQYFLVILLIMLFKVPLTRLSLLDKITQCNPISKADDQWFPRG